MQTLGLNMSDLKKPSFMNIIPSNSGLLHNDDSSVQIQGKTSLDNHAIGSKPNLRSESLDANLKQTTKKSTPSKTGQFIKRHL